MAAQAHALRRILYGDLRIPSSWDVQRVQGAETKQGLDQGDLLLDNTTGQLLRGQNSLLRIRVITRI